MKYKGQVSPPAPEELHLPAHSHTSNRRETTSNHITAWELYMKQNLLQLVIHMLFLWPNNGNGIQKACFQKHSCAFPKNTPHSSTYLIRQFTTFCQLAFLSYFSSSTSCQIISTTSFTGASHVFANYLSMM